MQTQTHNFGLLRRPLLPQNALFDFHQKVGNDPATFKGELLRIFSDPLLQDSIYLASRPLYESLHLQLSGLQAESPTKTYLALYKYLIRLSSRCTPFGLFAGTTTMEFRSHTVIKQADKAAIHTAIRLDAGIADQLCQYWQQQDELSSQLLYFPNSSLKRGPGCFQYMERVRDGSGQFTWTEVEYNEHLNSILMQAANGCHIEPLLQLLVTTKVDAFDGLVYIKTLIDSQVLVSELEAFCIHDDFLGWATCKLAGLENAEKQLNQLQLLREKLDANLTIAQKAQQINQTLEKDFQINTRDRCPIQADLFYPSDVVTLNKTAIGLIVADFERLTALTDAKENPALISFAKSFYERYQNQQIPLLSALDPSSGIEYGQHPTASSGQMLPGANVKRDSLSETFAISALNQFRLDLYRSALTEKKTSVQVLDSHLTSVKQKTENNSTANAEGVYLFGSLIAESAAAMDQGNFKYLHYAAGGPSAFNLMTRFCHGDHVLKGMVSQGISTEELCNEGFVFAEISHLPDLDSANILSRPLLRQHEICYLSRRPSSDNHVQLMADDLYVSVTAAHEIVLFSKSLNKRITPRLTNAHNYAYGLPVYKFLCDLARQPSALDINWDWDFLSNQPFLPRIEYKHIILSPATWNISERDTKTSNDDQFTLSERWEKASKSLGLPSLFYLTRGDNHLLIDSSSQFALAIFFDALTRHELVRIVEYVGSPELALLSDRGNHFANQIIIPLLSTHERPSIPLAQMLETHEQRDFLPGSEWLFVKIYCGPLEAEKIMLDAIYPLMKKLREQSQIEQWFFIRYQDGGHHLRLRLRIKGSWSSFDDLMPKINQALAPFLHFGLVSKVIVDTYQRELERYSGISYQAVESIFCFDSNNMLELLSSQLPVERLAVALVGADMILNDFTMTTDEKKLFYQGIALGLSQKLGINQHILNQGFRKQRALIEHAFHADKINYEKRAIESFFQDRSKAISFAIQRLKSPLRRQALAASFIHMFINRLFVSDHLHHELLVYHYLYKFISSQQARERNNAKKIQAAACM